MTRHPRPLLTDGQQWVRRAALATANEGPSACKRKGELPEKQSASQIFDRRRVCSPHTMPGVRPGMVRLSGCAEGQVLPAGLGSETQILAISFVSPR